MNAGLAASVHARLLKRARQRGEDFNLILTRFATERFLYRLSLSPERDRFLVKGALLFDLWFDVPHRPTRDADLLGFGPDDIGTLTATMRGICEIAAEDAMDFDPDTVRVEEIRENARYGGLRTNLIGRLGTARISVQVDVGFGDVVTPTPAEASFPTLLDDLPAPVLRVYPRETVVAEKLEAIVSLGMGNSRMKDYFDIRALAQEGKLDLDRLAEAIAATFERRQTGLPADLPVGLSVEFAEDAIKRTQWLAFLSRNRLTAPPLDDVVREIRMFLARPIETARKRLRG